MSQPTGKIRSQHRPTQRKSLPQYAVVLHRDELNRIGYTASILRRIFHFGRIKAYWIALRARWLKRCPVWRGNLEVAELKAEQILRCGTDMLYLDTEALPLHVTIEAVK